MRKGWATHTWGDAIVLNYGKAIRGYKDGSDEFPVFGTNGPVGTYPKALAEGPGVILGRKGAYRGVHFSKTPFFVIDTAYYVTTKLQIDMRWLYYAMQHYEIGQIDDGSPIPSTTRAAVYSYEFNMPPMEEQLEISEFLGSLDDKIELNCQMNETLEEMARALFRDWFVDFGPVKRKMAAASEEGATDPVKILGGAFPNPEKAAEIAALFPDRFGDDGLPVGWGRKLLYTYGSVTTGKTPSKKNKAFYGEDIPFLKIPDMHEKMYALNTADNLSFEGASSQQKKEMPEGSISVSCIATPGLVIFNHRKTHTNQQINTISPNNPKLSNFLYWICKQLSYEIMIGGSGGSVFHNMNKSTFENLSLVSSNEPLERMFSKVVDPIHLKILANQQESQTLAALRDLLLPKLMSGEIRLKNAHG